MVRRRTAAAEIAVHTVGEVVEDAGEYVRRQVAAVIRRLPGRYSSARVKLAVLGRASAPCPALAQVNVEIDGWPVRVQVAAAFLREAAGLLRVRLGQQVARLAMPWAPRPWPDSGPRRARPQPLRPVGRSEIVRQKTVSLVRCAPDEAALTMDLMDFDVHLFVDADTGEDSVVYRVGPTGYRLARLKSLAPPAGSMRLPLTVNVHPVPELSAEQAAEQLARTEYSFLFFRDADAGRGHVLYQRYDGHYGLVVAG